MFDKSTTLLTIDYVLCRLFLIKACLFVYIWMKLNDFIAFIYFNIWLKKNNTNDTKNKFGLVNRYPCVRFYGSLFAACLPGRLCHFGWLNFQQVKAIHSNSRSTAYSWSSLFIRMLEGCYHPETIRCRNKVLILFIGCIKFMMAALDRWNTNCALQQWTGLLTTSHISLNAFSLRSPLFQDI